MGGGSNVLSVSPSEEDVPRAGRNDPCPCGSGKKYKNATGHNLVYL